MKTNKPNFDNQVRLGWILFVIGLVLFGGGLLARSFAPGLAYARSISAVGLFAGSAGLGMLIKYRAYQKNPRSRLEEIDERSQSIRQRAGSTTFTWTLALTMIVLLVYSLITGSSQSEPLFSDPIWNILACLVVGPGLIYIFNLVRYNQKY